KPTIKHHYGNRVAMYTGDYILARALERITMIEKPAIHQSLSEAIVEVGSGDIEQIKDKYNTNQNIRHYLRRIKRKTGRLITTSSKLSAMSDALSEKHIIKL